ncbi:MAG: PAS domain-containing sensor histidine kinase [Elusimicrobiales bacterium]
MPNNIPEGKARDMLRFNAFAAGLMSLFASFSYFSETMPFHKGLSMLALLGALVYFLYFLLFGLICKFCYTRAGVILSQIGVVVVTAAVYFTGGLVSPFIFLYFAMLVSESFYGLDNPVTMPASIAGYLLVVLGHFFGFLPNLVPWSAAAYASPPAVLIIATLTVVYIALTKSMSARIISNLRGQVQREAGEKDALIRKFSELNSTTQLGVLAHRIAHDLRGPIAAVSGYLELEAAKAKDPEEKEVLRSVSETVDRMVESLHGITRFGKPGGPSAEAIPLAEFMKDLLAIVAFSPKAKGVRFELAPPAANGVTVTASRQDLQQAFFNVVKNAVDAVSANPGARTVSIAIERGGPDARVTVSDNGPGMSEETLKTVFRQSVTTKSDGTGVGLMITRDLLTRNRGGIKVLNGVNGGFSAVITLPAD